MVSRRAESALRNVRRLDEFYFGFNKTIKKSVIFELATERLVRARRGVLWLVPVGKVKSHLCQAIGLSLIRTEMTVY